MVHLGHQQPASRRIALEARRRNKSLNRARRNPALAGEAHSRTLHEMIGAVVFL